MRKSSHRNTGRSNTGRKGGGAHDDSPIPKPVRPGEEGGGGGLDLPDMGGAGVGRKVGGDW